MTGRTITVSDHALIRYLERVKGFDLDAVRDEIADAVGPLAGNGATKCSVDGTTFILDGWKVLTIVEGRSPQASQVRGSAKMGRSVRMRR